jgi:hypothetical protein
LGRRDIWHVAEYFARRIDHDRPRIDRDARGKCGLARAVVLAVQLR